MQAWLATSTIGQLMTRKLAPLTLCLCAGGVLMASHAPLHAQTAPDAGSLLRDNQKNLPNQAPPRTVPSIVAPPASASPADGAQVTVRQFVVKGAVSVPQPVIDEALSPWIGKMLGFAELRRAADAVSAVYRARGLLVRTYLPDQDLTDGVVTVMVVEGRLASVRIEKVGQASHLDETLARRYMLARQKEGQAVRTEDLERAISLLNELPGVSASSLLEPGKQEGESVVAVALRDSPFVTGLAQLDNTGARSTGEVRATGGISLNGPFKIGDQAQFLVNSSEGSWFARAAYSLPVGVDGWRVGTNVSWLDYDYKVSTVNYTGRAGDVGLSASYALRRTATSNINLAATWDRKDFRNLVQGVVLSDKTVSVANLSLSGDMSDGWLGGGITQYAIAVSRGRLDLSGDAGDLQADQAAQGPDRQGGFGKVTWFISRVQRLGEWDNLSLSFSGQSASGNLDSSEKFLATGLNGVRAYSTSEPSGDDATLLNLEWRHQFSEMLGTSVFYDTAHIKRDHRLNTSSLAPNAFDLSGAGFGVNYGKASGLNVRLTVAWRIGQNPARDAVTGLDADGTRRVPRAHLVVLKTF